MIGEVIILKRVGLVDLVRLIAKLNTYKMNLTDEKMIDTNRKSHNISHMIIKHRNEHLVALSDNQTQKEAGEQKK